MSWKSIRLELDRTEQFPRGSASRVYLLRLPLARDGRIDEAALETFPGRATVRRFWPNEPDLSGYVIKTEAGWGFSYEDGRIVSPLDADPIIKDAHIILTEPDGRALPFRVSSVQQLN